MVARENHDELLWQAIETGGLDDETQASDPELAKDFAAHQRLESLFELLRQPADAVTVTQNFGELPSQIGRYRIRSQLGRGSFGTVYLADDPELRRAVAIKLPNAESFASDDEAERFLSEARSAAALKHPSIVTIHDVGREDGRCFIVQEYIEGRTLEDELESAGMGTWKAVELMADVADALHFAHKNGFVHRDLKPSNIILDESGAPHVADFGLAVSEDSQRKLAGQVAGTPAYMSPEQVRGETHRLDGRTDIWSLGVVFYQLLTGRHPFWKGRIEDCLDEIQHREPKPPRQINEDIPSELERICLKCLSKDIKHRYTTAADIATDLRDCLATKTDQPRQRHAVNGRHSRLPIPAVFAGIVACIFLAVWFLPFSRDSRQTLPSPVSITVSGATAPVQSLLRMVYTQPLGSSSPTATFNIQKRHPERSNWLTLRNGDVLSSLDSYRVSVRCEQASYLYVIQIDSHGKLDWLHPANATSPFSSGANPTAPKTWIQIPDDQEAFFLDENLGVEHLYLVVTSKRWQDLETELQKATGKPGATEPIEKAFELKTRGVGGTRPASPGTEEAAVVAGIKGVLVNEIWFRHLAP